jgi:aminoglycoside phosphotransferase (APT) family kinase protein
MREALRRWLAQQRGVESAVDDLYRIATGNSRAMWYVGLADGARYVVRVEQGGVFGTSSTEEYRFMQAAGELGCRVATVRWLEATGDVIGHPFFVMDYVDSVAGGRNDRSLGAALAADYVRRLDELHRVDWTVALTADVTAADATHRQIDRWTTVYRTVAETSLPLLEEGAAWLHHHAPPLERMGVVHGDPGPGNFLHDGEHVVALTDWEFTHLGDPMEDWAYLVTMRGAKTMPPHEWLALFGDVAGVSVTDADLRYWSVFNFFKGACANLTCLRAFRTTNPAPNMAIIGTALHKTYMRTVARLIEGPS